MMARTKQAISALTASTGQRTKRRRGKLIHIRKFPKGHQVKLFRLVLSTERTDYVITNDLSQDSADAAQNECGVRWRIEQFHRETKQVTGIEACQCRSPRAQRNHIACALIVWANLKAPRTTSWSKYLPPQIRFA